MNKEGLLKNDEYVMSTSGGEGLEDSEELEEASKFEKTRGRI